MNAQRLDEKDPGETVPLSWDFAADLGAETGDSPSPGITGSPTISITVDNSLRRNTDLSDLDDMKSGSPQVDGTVVTQMITGGVHGVDYKVRCSVGINSTPAAALYKTSILPVRTQ